MAFTASAGMPHDDAFFSTYLTTLASASVKTPMSLQASSGVTLRAPASRTLFAFFSAASRGVQNSARRGGGWPAPPGAGACPPGNGAAGAAPWPGNGAGAGADDGNPPGAGAEDGKPPPGAGAEGHGAAAGAACPGAAGNCAK